MIFQKESDEEMSDQKSEVVDNGDESDASSVTEIYPGEDEEWTEESGSEDNISSDEELETDPELEGENDAFVDGELHIEKIKNLDLRNALDRVYKKS